MVIDPRATAETSPAIITILIFMAMFLFFQ